MRRGRRTQTAANPSEEPGEELQSPSMFLKAEIMPLLHERILFFLILSAASAFGRTCHCFQRLLIILLPAGKISHCLRPHNASSGI